MELKSALHALSALSQETRLTVFQRLVTAGPDGMAAGDLASFAQARPNTMSAHLAVLANAGLVRAERDGRSIRYTADMETMTALMGFLVQDCCGGRPEICGPLVAELSCKTGSREQS